MQIEACYARVSPHSTLYLFGNSNVGDAAKQSLRDAVQGRQGFKLYV